MEEEARAAVEEAWREMKKHLAEQQRLSEQDRPIQA